MTENNRIVTPGSTPLCDRYFSSLTDEEKSAIERVDAAELEREIRHRMPGTPRPKRTRPAYSVERLLRTWELLARMVAGEFPNVKWFFLEEYLNRLDRRDHLEDITLAELEGDTRARLVECLKELDAKFRESTVEDDGSAFGDWFKNYEDELRSKPWWWHRRPEPLPWRGLYPGVEGDPPEDYPSSPHAKE